MSQNKPWHLGVFAFCLGAVVYLASAVWSALFIVDLPQDPGAVVDVVAIERDGGRYEQQSYTEYVPTAFKTSLEELKYHHNVRMAERNRYWLYATLIFGAVAGYVAFCLVPRRRQGPGFRFDSTGSAVGGAFFGSFAAFIVPMFLGWILPAPAGWLPKQIREIADLRQREVLSQLEQVAAIQDRYEQP